MWKRWGIHHSILVSFAISIKMAVKRLISLWTWLGLSEQKSANLHYRHRLFDEKFLWQHIIIQSMIRWAVRHPMRQFCCAQHRHTYCEMMKKKRNSQSINDRPLAVVGLTVAVIIIIIINREKRANFRCLHAHNFLFHLFPLESKKYSL